MTKYSKKKSKKHNNNRIFRWDPSEREKDFKWIREFQKKIQNTFPTSSSSQHQRTVEGVSVKTTLKTDQEMLITPKFKNAKSVGLLHWNLYRRDHLVSTRRVDWGHHNSLSSCDRWSDETLVVGYVERCSRQVSLCSE